MRFWRRRERRSDAPGAIRPSPKHHLDRPGALPAPWRARTEKFPPAGSGTESRPAARSPAALRSERPLRRMPPAGRAPVAHRRRVRSGVEARLLGYRSGDRKPQGAARTGTSAAARQSVPAVLQALASDGRLHTVATLRSRPGDSRDHPRGDARERMSSVTPPEGRPSRGDPPEGFRQQGIPRGGKRTCPRRP